MLQFFWVKMVDVIVNENFDDDELELFGDLDGGNFDSSKMFELRMDAEAVLICLL